MAVLSYVVARVSTMWANQRPELKISAISLAGMVLTHATGAICKHSNPIQQNDTSLVKPDTVDLLVQTQTSFITATFPHTITYVFLRYSWPVLCYKDLQEQCSQSWGDGSLQAPCLRTALLPWRAGEGTWLQSHSHACTTLGETLLSTRQGPTITVYTFKDQ